MDSVHTILTVYRIVHGVLEVMCMVCTILNLVVVRMYSASKSMWPRD